MTTEKPKKVKMSGWRVLNLCIAMVMIFLVGVVAGFYSGTGTFPNLLLSAHEDVITPELAVETSAEDLTEALVEDKVDNEVYREGFNCVDFAWNAMRSLQWSGIQSTIVRLSFTDGTQHAILLVATSDRGWLYVDPQTDSSIIRPVVGGYFFDRKIESIDVLVMGWFDIQEFYDYPEFGISEEDE